MSGNEKDDRLTRRELGVISAAAGVAAVVGFPAGLSASAATPVTERDVTITTPDGLSDAAFFHPATGAYPAIIMWTDIFGLRPVFRDMGKRLAAQGYAVLVPNPYYRIGKPSITEGLSIADPAQRTQLFDFMKSLSKERIEKDSIAHLAFLDSQPAVKKSARAGVCGYCMGGRLSMITAAAAAARIGAGASFHGGSLVTEQPDSPHLQVPQMKARFYFAISEDDDEKEPHAKTALKDAFDKSSLPVDIEVYKGAKHGWCVSGKPVYDHELAEKAWEKMLALFKTSLV